MSEVIYSAMDRFYREIEILWFTPGFEDGANFDFAVV